MKKIKRDKRGRFMRASKPRTGQRRLRRAKTKKKVPIGTKVAPVTRPRRKVPRESRLRQRRVRRAHRVRSRVRPRRRSRLGARRKRGFKRPRYLKSEFARSRASRRVYPKRPKWIATVPFIDQIKKKWNIQIYRSDTPDKRLKYFLTGEKFFCWKKKFPPGPETGRRAFKYNVLYGWYVVFNPEEEEYYLWSRRNGLQRKITMDDLMKLIRKDPSLRRLSPEQAILRLPVHIRAPGGVTWDYAQKVKSHIFQDQIEEIEGDHMPTSVSPGGSYEVKEFVGWSLYPVAGTKL